MKTVNTSKKVEVEVGLPYFKQGDDLSHFLQNTNSPEEALLEHSKMMADTSEILERIAKIVKGKDVDICADTHFISITADEQTAQTLVDEELAYVPEWDNEEDWDEEE